MYCSKCGKELPSVSQFCAYCGEKQPHGAIAPAANALAGAPGKRLSKPVVLCALAAALVTAGILLFSNIGPSRREKFIPFENVISAGVGHTVGVMPDGSVVSAGVEDNVSSWEWNRIEAVSAGYFHTVGLRSDGAVVASLISNYMGGTANMGQTDVSHWRNISAVSAGAFHTVGLQMDGTVVGAGANGSFGGNSINFGQANFEGWRDIIAVSAGMAHTVGLKRDGTVVACGASGQLNGEYVDLGQTGVAMWKDIVAISAGAFHTVGLKSDGTVVACGAEGRIDGTDMDFGQTDVSGWRNIVEISAGAFHTVGLKADGTVVIAGTEGYVEGVGVLDYSRMDVSKWRDIVAVSAGLFHTVGLKADGSAVAVIIDNPDYNTGQSNVETWSDIGRQTTPEPAAHSKTSGSGYSEFDYYGFYDYLDRNYPIYKILPYNQPYDDFNIYYEIENLDEFRLMANIVISSGGSVPYDGKTRDEQRRLGRELAEGWLEGYRQRSGDQTEYEITYEYYTMNEEGVYNPLDEDGEAASINAIPEYDPDENPLAYELPIHGDGFRIDPSWIHADFTIIVTLFAANTEDGSPEYIESNRLNFLDWYADYKARTGDQYDYPIIYEIY